MPTSVLRKILTEAQMWGLSLPDAMGHILLLTGNSQKEHAVTDVYCSRARGAQECMPLAREGGDRDSSQEHPSPAQSCSLLRSHACLVRDRGLRSSLPLSVSNKGKQLLLDVTRPHTFSASSIKVIKNPESLLFPPQLLAPAETG